MQWSIVGKCPAFVALRPPPPPCQALQSLGVWHRLLNTSEYTETS